MTVTKAYILDDGEIVTEEYMQKYAIKQSKQLPSDEFTEREYNEGIVEPLYCLEALAELLEINTYHYRAVKTKARDVAGLGWYLEPAENIENPSMEQKKKVDDFFKNVNPHMTFAELNDRMMVDFEATGNGYQEVIRDEKGELIGLEHIPAHTIRIHRDNMRFVQKRGNKKVWFKRFGFEQDVHVKTGEIYPKGTLSPEERANEILHLKNYTSRSDYYGVPDIIPAVRAIISEKEIQEYNISFFDNHAIPAYAVTVTGADLDDETERAIRQFFQRDAKVKRHSTLVITAKKGQGDYTSDPIKIEFHPLSTEIKEASFRMYRQDNRDEILSAHGVPPYRAGITVEGSLGGSTARESTEIYKQSIIKPKQEMLENRINRFILREGLGVTDWYFRFKEIDTKDTDREIERLERLFRMGVYSPNMILQELGKDRIDNPLMDRHFINGIPIDTNVTNGNDEIIKAVKDLHKQLVEIVTKKVNDDETNS